MGCGTRKAMSTSGAVTLGDIADRLPMLEVGRVGASNMPKFRLGGIDPVLSFLCHPIVGFGDAQ
jgi:hypothetical protein